MWDSNWRSEYQRKLISAEEAANFYTSIFQDSEIGKTSRFGKEGFEFHGKPEGTVMTVKFFFFIIIFLFIY